jgi:2-dehydro-3-deoxygluconokinase
MAGYQSAYTVGNAVGRGGEDAVKVVCVGETMLMLAPPRYELIEHCDQFTAYSGGSESNVAIGLERLGVHAGWIGKLPDNPLGHKIANGIRAYGVDTSACVWTQEGRVGTFFVEWGAYPRPLRTIYDRAGSAAATLAAGDLDWGYIERSEWLHLTGITPALSETCRKSTGQIVARARERGCRVSFDVNYRSLLWSPCEARATLHDVLPHVNILVATAADAAMLLGQECEREELAKRLFDVYAPDAAIITCGADGSMAYDGDHLYRSRGYRVQVVNRLGAGDAFDAGLLYGYLMSGLQAGLDYGSAMAALKVTIPQNTPLIEREDVARLLLGSDLDVLR